MSKTKHSFQTPKIAAPTRWIEPQLCKLVEKAPTGDKWIHEIKFDGYRMAARIDRGQVQLLTRSGLDWTEKYPVTAAALAKLPVKTAYIDGELCSVRPDGVKAETERFDLCAVAGGGGEGRVVAARPQTESDGDIGVQIAQRAERRQDDPPGRAGLRFAWQEG